MKANLKQLEEIQKELFKQQCDLDIQKAMVKHFIKKKKYEQLTLTDVSQQRELLIDFCTKLELKAKQYSYLIPDEDFIDEYLKDN